MVKYAQIKMPANLVDMVEAYRKDHPELGFRNRSEIIISVIRRFVTDAVGHDQKMKELQERYKKRKKKTTESGMKILPPVDLTDNRRWFG